MYYLLADLHHWTPEQIAEMGLDFVEELVIRERAKQDVAEAKARREERKARRKGRHSDGEDCDISEIT